MEDINKQIKMKNGCTMCGACCRHLILRLKVTDEDEQQFYRARGFKVDGTHVDIDLPHICPQLTKDNRCKLHGMKPELCRLYPAYVATKDLNPCCGYRLKRKTY